MSSERAPVAHSLHRPAQLRPRSKLAISLTFHFVEYYSIAVLDAVMSQFYLEV